MPEVRETGAAPARDPLSPDDVSRLRHCHDPKALIAVGFSAVTYLDCDVEAPNGHIFLKPVIRSREAVRCIPCGSRAEIAMLAYEYKCQHCGRQFERRQAITEPPLTACPECGGEVRRLLSGGAGILVRGGAGHEREGHGGSCGFRENGATCCGRPERCDRPPCEGDR